MNTGDKDDSSLSNSAAHDLTAPAESLLQESQALFDRLAGEPQCAELRSDLQKVCQAGTRLLANLSVTTAAHGRAATRAETRHELATPLNHIIGYCELWIDEDHLEVANSMGELTIIRANAWNLLHCINELLGSGSDERKFD